MEFFSVLWFIVDLAHIVFGIVFYFLTHMDYSPWSEREIWPFLKTSEKGQNLRN